MEFALHILKPEEIARLIILLPTEHVPAPKFWRKREMRLHPTRSRKPAPFDERTLARAADDDRWRIYRLEEAERIPRLAVLEGPLLRSGRYLSSEPIDNPLVFWNSIPEAQTYTRKQMEADVEGLKATKNWLWHRYVRGQVGEAPVMLGIVYQAADHLLDCKIADCKNRFKLLDSMRLTKRKLKAQAGTWRDIGKDEAIAKAWQHGGFTVRKSLANYEVLV